MTFPRDISEGKFVAEEHATSSVVMVSAGLVGIALFALSVLV